MLGSRSALVAMLALAATACGDSSSTSATSAAPPATPGVPTTLVVMTIPVAPTTIAAPTTTAPATTASPPATVGLTATTIPPPAQPCAAAALSLTAQPSDGAMGSIYTSLRLANTGAAACTVSTHMVLTFLDSSGQSIGASVATPEASGPALIMLAPVESRQTVLRYAQSGNLDCQPIDTATTAQLIVNQTETLALPPAVWPLCPDRLADQVTLGDLETPTP